MLRHVKTSNTRTAFGSLMPQRFQSAGGYRYGFQGQEKDDEVKGIGNSINYDYRVYDTRIGKFLSIDPLIEDYPEYSPYHFSSNQPIHAPELEGLESSHDLNRNDPNYQMGNEKEKENIRNAQGIAGGIAILAGLSAAFGVKAVLTYIGVEITEELAGFPIIPDPGDALQHGVKKSLSKPAINIAKEGGRHKGHYLTHKNLSDKELKQSSENLQKVIKKHEDLINNPKESWTKYGKDKESGKMWDDLDPRQQKALVEKKWKSDIKNAREKIEINEEIINERKK
jgi:RHS repeat-associated protein